ncbi:MAG: FAD-dependent oxidoreductase, partial [Metallosphaera sp.]
MNVAIVGGGIVGLFSAYFLAREGVNVAIYD